ncbi:MAG TPA: mechanosensitive ion channel domain-containing protein [Gaiellaceae bacterium]|nr:mechanosensitive ion channel domain-containing protein [Gaiellaceae bacterium]
MSHAWTRVAVAGGVILVAVAVAKLIDGRIGRRELDPATATRYRVLRRSLVSAVVFVGVLSALLVIPQVRAVAGGILASGAVLAVVLGFAAQRTIGNFIAGILIALSQPLRLGDEIEVEGDRGVVEEIGLTYTWVRLPDGNRLVVPNERLVSASLRNATIRSPTQLAEVTVKVPLACDLRELVSSLAGDANEAYVSALGEDATIVLRRWVESGHGVEEAESDLRLAVHDRLRALGIVSS